ncbi:PIN domain nuclease, a component of toxin-antitoxin system (PIN domain) [Modestobacter sp. DSM 44400]|uniref:type II toxin-antitoxin system VapC family toxin n=1 Tax=Modestobacter sp. DSM 44400 TaxID=1550230 RepID=UPI00089B8FC6|nr:type II toxin-antitoxin system VapC family toxin [Modestobacter sp. DSM 44400]SDY15792.1 PIN domain nuclease, a component of toxin-antitoxin system (PIN domain) [Modestobacter sp. DSM 44400]
MRLLLDTHVLLWWLDGDTRLTGEATEAIATAELAVVSAASCWEIGIKQAIGKLSGPADVEAEIADNGFTPLSISAGHALAAARLPDHHRDPFDRMLIAQGIAEGLTVVTRDPRFAEYGVPLLTT